jgi:ABC-type Fe3+ transport system permease subunit
VSAGLFLVASSLGKIPALLLEAWSVYEVTQAGTTGKIILAITAVVLLYVLIVRRNQKR